MPRPALLHACRPSARRLAALVFVLALFAGAPAARAQVMANPHTVSFLPSADDGSVGADGQYIVSRYELEFYLVGATQPSLVLNLGRPAPAADGSVTVDFWSLLASPPMPGQVLEARVAAVGPAGKGDSTPSNPFMFDAVAPPPPPASIVTASPTALRFAAAKSPGSSTLAATTGAQTVSVGFGSAAAAWSVSTSQPWLRIIGGSGTGSGSFTVGIQNPGDVIGTSTSLSGAVIVTPVAAPGAPLAIPVTLTVDQTGGATTQPPIGLVDSPAQNATGQVGAIGVTGWVVDDVGVRSVKIYRTCLAFEPAIDCAVVNGVNLVYVGDATLVAGARPDVEAIYASYPQANRAGWGYLLLTNLLPHVPSQVMFGGQGAVTLWVLAEDVEGHQRWLGRNFATYPIETDQVPTTFTMANDTIARPFGAIDTPTQGQTVSGAFWNWGWTLTPDSNTAAGAGDILMPVDGSTQWVYVDGVAVGRVGAYNLCRGSVGSPVPAGAYCDDDVASLFGNPTPQPTFTFRPANPTRYRNLDAGRGSIAAHWLDTTTLGNGLHTLVWGVTDSAGRGEGIGSRYFTVANGAGAAAMTALDTAPAVSGPVPVAGGAAQAMAGALRGAPRASRRDATGLDVGRPAVGADRGQTGAGDAGVLNTIRSTVGAVRGRAGFTPSAPYADLIADETGVRQVQIPDLGRLELELGPTARGYLAANGTLRDLPPGSRLNPQTGVFTWSPGLGYRGTYRLVFVRDQEQVAIDVAVRPVPSSEPAEHTVRMAIESPTGDATVAGAVTIAGWALDPQAWTGSGIGEVQVWAQRVDMPTAEPRLLGSAVLGAVRRDVAQAHGAMFGTAGFSLTTDTLGAGTYDLLVYPRRAGATTFDGAQAVRVVVK